MNLSFCDTEEEMQRLRDCAPAVFPPDHDPEAAAKELATGAPGCPCQACSRRREALFKLVSSPSMQTLPSKAISSVKPRKIVLDPSSNKALYSINGTGPIKTFVRALSKITSPKDFKDQSPKALISKLASSLRAVPVATVA